MSLLGLAASAFATMVNRIATQAAAESNAAATGMPAAMPMPEAPGDAYYLDGSGQYRISVPGYKTMANLWPRVRVAARLTDWYPQGGAGDPNKQPGGPEYLSPADWAMLNGRWGVIRSAANWTDLGWHLIQPQVAAPPPPPPPPPLVSTPMLPVIPTTIKLTPTAPAARTAVDVSGPVSTGIDWSAMFQQGPSTPVPPQPTPIQYAQGDSFTNEAPTQASMAPAAGTPWSTYAMYAALGVGVLYMLKDMGASVHRGSTRRRGARRRR